MSEARTTDAPLASCPPPHAVRGGVRFGFWGLGFRGLDLGFGVWGLGFGVWGLGFGVQGLEFIQGLGLRVEG